MTDRTRLIQSPALSIAEFFRAVNETVLRRIWNCRTGGMPQAVVRVITGMLILGWTLVGLPALQLSADDGLARYYSGLRHRGLYRVAEADCLRRLGDATISPGERAELAIELSRSYAEHASFRSGQEREELWNQAIQVIDLLIDSKPTPSHRVLLETQRAFVLASRGTQLRWQVDLTPLDQQSAEQAANVLRKAIDSMRPLSDALEEQSRLVAGGAATEGVTNNDLPTLHLLREMRHRVEYRTAVAMVDLVKVLPTGPERAAALHEAETRLKELVKTPKADERAWWSEVMLIQLLRLQGDFDRVEPRVSALLEKESPSAIQDAAVAELIRTQLDQQQPDAAISTLKSHRGENGWKSDELKCLVVETLLAARTVAFEKGQTETADELLKQAESYAADVEGAWGARCRVLLEVARESDIYGPKLANLVRQAKWAWKNGNLDEAVHSYRQATAEAHRSGRAEYAVEFGLTLATLQTESGQIEGAIDTLKGLLKSYPSSDKAAEADLLRTYAIGKQFEKQPDEEHRQAYREALIRHRADYDGSPTSVEAAWMLARLDEYERNWSSAIAMLKSIPPENKRWPAASGRIAVIYEHLLQEFEQRGEPTEAIKQQAVNDLSSLVGQFGVGSNQRQPEQAQTVLQLANLLLQQETPEFERADALLEQIVSSNHSEKDSGSSTIKPEVLASASRLRIISLAGQGRLDDAKEVLNQLAIDQPQRMLEVLNGLTSAAEQVAIQHRRAVSELQLEVSQRLEKQRDTLSVDAQIQLDECLAQSYAAIGNVSKAATLYEKLIWQQPNNLQLVKSLAMLYVSCGTPGCLRNALEQWEKLEHQQKKGTTEWLESRYQLAWCNHQLGDDETARKLIGVTRVLYPELGGQQLTEKFTELSAELNASKQNQK